MIRNFKVTKVFIAVLALTLASCSSWHYKTPRVSVERDIDVKVSQEKGSYMELASLPKAKVMEDSKMEPFAVVNHNPNTHQSNVLSSAKITSNKLPAVTHTNYTKSKPPFKLFADHFRKKTKSLHSIKNVEKTALSGWVRIMVILFVVGFILLLVGIFFSVFIFGGFWWLFYAFGALLIFAGIIVLILGLLGII